MIDMATRRQIISLYRDCLHCVKRIPNLDYKQTYNIYVKESFRSKTSVASLQARIDDGREQLERMNYYLSIAKLKCDNSDSSLTNSVDDEKVTMIQDASNGSHKSTRMEPVKKWMQASLSFLNPSDIDHYVDKLFADGFDSVQIIKMELRDEDLGFMKKAHRRALNRYLSEIRHESG